jgi:hypothetical protein
METLIKSPKITRGKGIRSVKEEDKEYVNDRNVAYTKLFDHYLSEQRPDKTLIRKLTKHDYFADLLRNKRELQNMQMELLSEVLLFLDSRDDDLFDKDPKAEILNYLNNSTTKQVKKINILDDITIVENKKVLDFFRYIGYVKLLMDNNKFKNYEKEEEKLWNKTSKLEMINPHKDEDEY